MLASFARAPWNYTPHIACPRLDYLERDESFAQILADLHQHARALSLTIRRGPAFIVSTPGRENLLDRFFNSRAGYRAQYYLSIEQGEQANRATIEALLEKLIEAISKDSGETTVPMLRQSLLRSAEVWINSDAILELEGPREIDAKRWMDHANSGFAEHAWDAESTAAEMGLRAPIPEHLVVLGGRLDRTHNGEVTQRPRARSLRLHQLGWV